jgi:Gdp/GTP exchange factor required for growth at low temperatures
MHWPLPRSPSFSTHSLPVEAATGSFEDAGKPAIIEHPFGPSVTFDSPSRKPGQEYLPTPRHLREVQSFESGLTARQVDPEPESVSRPEKSSSPSPILPSESSFRSVSPPPLFVGSPDIDVPSSPSFGPAPETSMHSRYSTDVFDVLQTYRGLPLLDKLSPDSGETTVIKMSLGSDESAAPRDDPRFVIWGETPSLIDNDGFSISQGSLADRSTSAHSSIASRRKSGKGNRALDIPKVKVSTGENMQKILVAATIERWIAQLTSDLNYDELLIFFLTYRTYVSSVDLCHLLICRFHWALGKASSKHDETVRRIVRVRTFVAIRYWLLTFFAVDFLPNRELRMLLASWLNTLIRDPVLKKHSDGLVSSFPSLTH